MIPCWLILLSSASCWLMLGPNKACCKVCVCGCTLIWLCEKSYSVVARTSKQQNLGSFILLLFMTYSSQYIYTCDMKNLAGF